MFFQDGCETDKPKTPIFNRVRASPPLHLLEKFFPVSKKQMQLKTKCNLLVEQTLSAKPSGQLQAWLTPSSTQVPPFSQGSFSSHRPSTTKKASSAVKCRSEPPQNRIIKRLVCLDLSKAGYTLQTSRTNNKHYQDTIMLG